MLGAISAVAMVAAAAWPVSATVAGTRVDCGVAGGALLPGDPGDFADEPLFVACRDAAGPAVLIFFALGLIALALGSAGFVLWHRSARRRHEQ